MEGDTFSGSGNHLDGKVIQTFQKSFSRVQNILDQNRILISEINQNHESKVPDNLSRNVGLIRELNNNIRRVVDLYSDLSSNFSKSVEASSEGELSGTLKSDGKAAHKRIRPVLERADPHNAQMVIDNDLLAKQLMSLLCAKKRKRKVKDLDAFLGAGGSTRMPSTRQGILEYTIEVEDAPKVKSERQVIVDSDGPVPRSKGGKCKRTDLPPSSSSRSVTISAFTPHGSSSHSAGISEHPDGSKVGWLFGNYGTDYLSSLPSPDDTERLDSMEYAAKVEATRIALGAFSTLFADFQSMSLAEHGKVGVAEHTERDIARYKNDAFSANSAMKLEMERNVSLSQQIQDLEIEIGGQKKEIEGLKAKMARLPQDVIDEYKKSVAFSRTVTGEASRIIPKAFRSSKKFLQDNPHGTLGDFTPFFIATPDDIEDEDESKYESDDAEDPDAEVDAGNVTHVSDAERAAGASFDPLEI